jgi:hypothetical protein
VHLSPAGIGGKTHGCFAIESIEFQGIGMHKGVTVFPVRVFVKADSSESREGLEKG